MFIKRSISTIVVLIFALFILLGCKDKLIEENDTPTLGVVQSNFVLLEGGSASIELIVDGSTEDIKVIYSSSNDLVATVQDGLITAIKAGEVIITVSLEDYPEVTKEVTVTVEKTEEEQILDEIMEWSKDFVGTELNMPLMLPSTHPDYSSEIVWESSDEEKLTNTGMISQSKYDQTVDLTITVTYNEASISEVIEVIITGYVPESIANDFLKQFSNLITRSYDELKTTNNSYPNAIITWYSSDTSVFTNDGLYIKPFNDVKFNIHVIVTIEADGITKEFIKEVTAQGTTIYEKVDAIKEWAIIQMNITSLITDDIEMPIRNDEYEATLVWTSDKPEVISSTGILSQPNNNELVKLKCEVTINNNKTSFYIDVEVEGIQYDEKWDAVDALLNIIFKDEIKTQKFTNYGVHPSYLSFNYGYLPFYVNERSTVIDGLIPLSNVNRPGRLMTEVKYVVIHDTANNGEGADAEMHNRYIQNATNASWHYTVDDTEIYQHVPNREVAWHAGDSEGNNHGIGIETCIQVGVDYNVVMRKTAKLTSELLNEFDLSLFNVKQHYDFSGKDCPHVMRASNRWNEFLELVAIEYLAITQLEGVEFVWESLSPSILDSTGRITDLSGIQADVSYKVNVSYNGETREFTHVASLLPATWL